ncbi:abscisic-aldehyde oxidase [Pyrus ussuriensis x Pyrus communis]|uniref:Abscisic-aldehyde oxidase n=1 Tax=Pyrus ussuriensis x Pyrus communis TaxID=2448454 RepID=A0A5N5FYZ6_9ROSA|nr:abscisic-aldehyde oxidase [Pyrus ussuriensis x Pyrus communis]
MLLFETYRAAPRPLGSALTYLNAAFLAEVSFWKIFNGIMVDHCRLVFGAYGTKHAIRARKVEEFLTGKVLSPGVLYDAIKLVRDVVVSREVRSEYDPVDKSITKSGGLIQASGEAVYVDDIPSPKYCLHGAFIYSTKPLARVKGIKFEPKPHPGASLQDVNLQASSYYVPDFASKRYLNYGAAVEVNVLTGQTRILRSDIIYDCGQSLNPAVDLGQIEGAFVQGIGFFMLEEYSENSDGLVISEGTWTYKIPTMDTIPKQFNVEVLNSGHHKKSVLSSKASGEPPLLLAVSVHCATRAAIKESRKQLLEWGDLDGSASIFPLDVPATMPIVKELCGLAAVERYLEWIVGGE